jgi:hypothetical protein
MTAVAVGTAGMIAFVGLVAPHIARGLLGMDWRKSLPASIVVGSALLLIADILTQRVIPLATERLGFTPRSAGGSRHGTDRRTVAAHLVAPRELSAELNVPSILLDRHSQLTLDSAAFVLGQIRLAQLSFVQHLVQIDVKLFCFVPRQDQPHIS